MRSEGFKNAVVLGATGFIGRGVAKTLSMKGFGVNRVGSKDINLAESKETESKLPEMLEESALIVVAAKTVDKGDSFEAMSENIKMYTNIASVINRRRVRHLVYFSTVDVYGKKDLALPLSEASRIQPHSYYAISKVFGEFVFGKACFDEGIPLTVLRLPRIYGPDDRRSAIDIFMRSAIKKESITVNGDGAQKRDFVYMEDISTAVNLILLNKTEGTYNMVTGRSYAINQIMEFIGDITGNKPVVIYEKGRGDIDLVFERPKILERLDGFSFVDLRSGLKMIHDLYESRPDGV